MPGITISFVNISPPQLHERDSKSPAGYLRQQESLGQRRSYNTPDASKSFSLAGVADDEINYFTSLSLVRYRSG